ncbi:hypothetical protein Pla123a_35160 [Posidoniimonas polymericola]|uniref:PEP-CTERM protein-sorting domain-containing protein n=1 Tax=Posidoniimonas polymericola TaxID=2528002 RepID=A0A5C5YIJ8_9BACT|nr:PEP-CTERM sorting domain-containing protein [Posidoniimonas polymericola]TWT74692.1 hypothetical protein Pla123a_35160 [Posidoniimonas polymericola]
MTRTLPVLAATAAAATLFAAAANAALFSDDFNDGAAGTRWSIVSQQEGEVGPDGSVDFAFDYSTLGIANPSGGTDTTGVFVQVNKVDDGPVNEGESYAIYPTGMSFSGNYTLLADMFVYNDGGGGSTEHGMAGLFLDNNAPVAPYEFGASGGPLAWVYSGEGGDGTGDLGIYAEGNATSTGYTGLGDYADQPVLPAGFDASAGPASTNPRGSWVKVGVRVNGDLVSYMLNGVVMDTYDNSGGFYSGGNILLGGMDVFNSANGANGVIIDNVVVTPEPASVALALLGCLTAVGRKRRR